MEEQNPDNPDHHEPSVIEKFRQQEKRQLKYLLASLGLFLLLALNVLMDILFISLKSNPTWRSWMICLMVFFAVGIIVLGIISFAMGTCPACETPLGKNFWISKYCPHCGAKLREP